MSNLDSNVWIVAARRVISESFSDLPWSKRADYQEKARVFYEAMSSSVDKETAYYRLVKFIEDQYALVERNRNQRV